jgi:spore coat protein U-like protein
MKMSKLAVAGALALASFGAAAATSTTTFAVSTNVQASCAVSASPLAFANVDPITNQTSSTDGTTTVAVTCSNTTPYNVGLSAGAATGATVGGRKMTIGATSDTLDYALYSDSNRSQNWGETVDTDTVAGIGDGTAQPLTVYGRIPSGQGTAKVGAYTDTITVTVSY